MKASRRWLLFLGGVVVLFLGIHYLLVPSWASYPMIGWGFHRFGPRIFPWGSFIGLLAIIGSGFLLYKLIFPLSGSQATKEKENFCPCCGREFPQNEEISKKILETPGSEESGK
jgi:nitrate reductase gamma subunit